MEGISIGDYPPVKVTEDTYCEVCGCKVQAGLYVAMVSGKRVCTSSCADVMATYEESLSEIKESKEGIEQLKEEIESREGDITSAMMKLDEVKDVVRTGRAMAPSTP